MSQVQSAQPPSPLIAADDALEGHSRHEDDSWSDTFLIAGLVVVLGVLMFLLIG